MSELEDAFQLARNVRKAIKLLEKDNCTLEYAIKKSTLNSNEFMEILKDTHHQDIIDRYPILKYTTY